MIPKMVTGAMGKGTNYLMNAGKNMSGAGKFGAIGFGMDAAGNVFLNGDDVGTATMKAGVTGALFASNPVVGTGLMFGSMAIDAGWGIKEHAYKKRQWWNAQYATNNMVGGNYMDTQRAMTMRQAAVQAIQGSKLNARSALGGEAKIMNPYSSRR